MVDQGGGGTIGDVWEVGLVERFGRWVGFRERRGNVFYLLLSFAILLMVPTISFYSSAKSSLGGFEQMLAFVEKNPAGTSS